MKRYLGMPDKGKVMSLRRVNRYLEVYNKTDDFKRFYTSERF